VVHAERGESIGAGGEGEGDSGGADGRGYKVAIRLGVFGQQAAGTDKPAGASEVAVEERRGSDSGAGEAELGGGIGALGVEEKIPGV
jgi:hypothetical protein